MANVHDSVNVHVSLTLTILASFCANVTRGNGAAVPGRSSIGAQNGVKKVRYFVIFRKTRAVYAMCIITEIVIWLLNRLGLCLRKKLGVHFKIFAPGGQTVTLCP